MPFDAYNTSNTTEAVDSDLGRHVVVWGWLSLLVRIREVSIGGMDINRAFIPGSVRMKACATHVMEDLELSQSIEKSKSRDEIVESLQLWCDGRRRELFVSLSNGGMVEWWGDVDVEGQGSPQQK